MSHEEDDSEAEISFSVYEGQLQANSPQVVNYQLQSVLLEHLSLWEFVATANKVCLWKESNQAPIIGSVHSLSSINNVQQTGSTFRFLPCHPQYDTHGITL